MLKKAFLFKQTNLNSKKGIGAYWELQNSTIFFFLTFLQQYDEFSSAPPPRSWKDNSADQVFQTVGPTVKCNGNLPNLSALSRDAWPARTHALLYILQPCTEIQKYRHTEIHFTTLHGNTRRTAVVATPCNSASRQSGIVEAHFRDADNNQHRSFQGRETLPLIEDSTVRGFRVKVQQQEEFLLLANRFSFVTFSIKLGQSLNKHIKIDILIWRKFLKFISFPLKKT